MVNYIKRGNGMKKKILTMLVLMAVLLPSLFLFASCKKTDSAPTVSSITLVRSTGEEVSMFEYTYGAVTNPLRDISLKVTYSDASTKILNLTDSGIKMTYTYKTMNASDEEAVELPALPDDNEYQAGVYEITISYSKQQIVVPIHVYAAGAGGNFALTFNNQQKTRSWDYANNPELESFINELTVVGKTTYTPTNEDLYFLSLEEWQGLQQECGESGVGKYSLPNTAKAQTLLNDNTTYLYNTLLYPGEYVLIAKVPASNNYNEQFTVHGVGLTITKTVLTETTGNIAKEIDLSYKTLDEIIYGIPVDSLAGNGFDVALSSALSIQDEKGNTYSAENFHFGEQWVDLPESIHYETSNESYEHSCTALSWIKKIDSTETYYLEGFDISGLNVHVKFNITPVTISVDKAVTKTVSVHEFLADPSNNENRFVLQATGLSNGIDIYDVVSFGLLLNGEEVPYDAGTQVEHMGNSFWLTMAETQIQLGTYTIEVLEKYTAAVLVEGNATAGALTMIPSTIDIDNNVSTPTVTPSPDGTVVIKFPLQWTGSTVYSYGVLTDASVINEESLQLSMAPESAVTLENATFTVGTEDGQVYIQCTAKVTAMTGAYGTASFTISGTSDSSFYADIQIENTATVSKYTLQETDYIYTKAGTALNNNLSNSITLTQTSGEQFRFEDYIQVSTLTNAYGKWKICAFGGVDTPGEEINVSTLIDAPEGNRNYFLVFTSNNEMYCESVTLPLTVYVSTIEA